MYKNDCGMVELELVHGFCLTGFGYGDMKNGL